MNGAEQSNADFNERFGKALKRVLRIALILLVLAGIIAIIYYGTPYVYQQFILPVEKNSNRISMLESTQLEEIKQLKNQLAELQTRLSVAETSLTSANQKMSRLEGDYLALQEVIDDQAMQLSQIELLKGSFVELKDELDTHQGDISSLEVQINGLESRIRFTQAAGFLARARTYSYQSNFGLAERDVQMSYTLLLELKNQSPEETELVSTILERLELVMENLPEYPILAAADLEIAWQALTGGQMEIEPVVPTRLMLTPTSSVIITPTAVTATTTETPPTGITLTP